MADDFPRDRPHLLRDNGVREPYRRLREGARLYGQRLSTSCVLRKQIAG